MSKRTDDLRKIPAGRIYRREVKLEAACGCAACVKARALPPPICDDPQIGETPLGLQTMRYAAEES